MKDKNSKLIKELEGLQNELQKAERNETGTSEGTFKLGLLI